MCFNLTFVRNDDILLHRVSGSHSLHKILIFCSVTAIWNTLPSVTAVLLLLARIKRKP